MLIERKSVSPRAVLPLLLLLSALSTVFMFGNDRSRFYRGPHHVHLSSQSMALAANLSPDHHFLMFFRQTLDVSSAQGYEPYNRFPIGTYALIKLSTLPFADSLAKQIYAARILMLSCFIATAVLAYYALCRLVSNRWIALTATLLAFSSTYCLYYNDMISTEITSLFGVLLTFHGMVVFIQKKALPAADFQDMRCLAAWLARLFSSTSFYRFRFCNRSNQQEYFRSQSLFHYYYSVSHSPSDTWCYRFASQCVFCDSTIRQSVS